MYEALQCTSTRPRKYDMIAHIEMHRTVYEPALLFFGHITVYP